MLPFLFILFFFENKIKCQVLNGDTIFVNDELQVGIDFPSNIYDAKLTYDNLPFKLTKSKNHLLIIATSKESKCATAAIEEYAKRSHLITLCYKKGLRTDTENEDHYDFSTLKKLETFVSEANKKRAMALVLNKPPQENYYKAPVKTDNSQIDGLVKSGNEALKNKDWKTANSKYKEALQIDQGNYQAKKGLDDIIIAQKQEIKNHIELGNKAEINKQYDVASDEYDEVLKIDPADEFALKKKIKINTLKRNEEADKIARTERLEQLKKQAEVDRLKIEALTLLSEKKYDLSINTFSKILTLDGNDNFSKNKIAEIQKIKQQEETYQKQKNNDETFNKLITDGDNALKNNELELAKSFYAAAKDLKPSDPNVIQKIQTINKKIEIKEKEDNYQNAINLGDQAYKAGEYEKAKEIYTAASNLYKDRQYPLDQIAKIIQTTIKISNENKKNQEYQEAIARGDQYFNSNNLTAAKISYSNAVKIKPQEEYPQLKLSEIGLVADSITRTKEKSLKFESALNKGKQAEAKLKYTEAKSFYNEALALQPDNEFLANKIEEINRKMNVGKGDVLYDSLMEKGNIAAAESGDYKLALSYFTQAQNLKPNENYPVKQINWVKSMLSNDSTKKAIGEADEAEKIKKRNETLQFEIQKSRALEAMDAYKKYVKAAERADFELEIFYLKKYLNIIPNDSVYSKYFNTNQFADDPIGFAKDKIESLRKELVRTKGASYQPLVDSIPYLDQEFEKKYENININSVNEQQEMNGIDNESVLDEISRTKLFLTEKSRLNIKDSTENTILSVEGINFVNNKLYIKFRIENNNQTDFITGAMYLCTQRKDGSIVKNLPDFISARPIVLPGKEFPVFYGTKEVILNESDSLFFEISSPLRKQKLKAKISFEDYNLEKNRKH